MISFHSMKLGPLIPLFYRRETKAQNLSKLSKGTQLGSRRSRIQTQAVIQALIRPLTFPGVKADLIFSL